MLSSFIVLGGIALACILVFELLRPKQRRGWDFSAADYQAKPLLSRWEKRALAEIRAELPRGYYACPQVRLADFIEIQVGDPARRRAALSRVAQKSVDFAVIDLEGSVVLVVELDDRSHQRPDRVRRDQQVGAVLAHCGVALLRVRPGQRVGIGRFLPDLFPLAAD